MLSENINLLKKEINKACLDAGRDPKEITLMGASKSQTVENINLAYESGVSHFGENYLQEAELKINKISNNVINVPKSSGEIIKGYGPEQVLVC